MLHQLRGRGILVRFWGHSLLSDKFVVILLICCILLNNLFLRTLVNKWPTRFYLANLKLTTIFCDFQLIVILRRDIVFDYLLLLF
jgi:hypothetical protein